MKLMTKEIEAVFRKTGRQEEVKNPLVIVKYFNPAGAGTWYATEISQFRLVNHITGHMTAVESFEEKDTLIAQGYMVDDIILFGYASIFGDDNDEWGDFSLKELEEFRGTFGMRIERDIHCGVKPITEFHISSLCIQ